MADSVLGPGAIAQLRADHRKLNRLGAPGQSVAAPSYHTPATDRRRVVIIGSLTAPSSANVAPTSCVCAVLQRNATTGVLTASALRITAKNYSPGLTGADGTYAKVEWLEGCWEVYWVDCNPSAGLTGLTP